jgi:hypothetical protein
MNARVNRRAVPKALRWVAVAVASAALLSACGDKQEKEKPATQTAAKVNKEEITVHQINAVLSQQRGLKPEQTDEAGRRVLERLIDQELAVQKAAELKVDRDPRVLQAGEGAPQPSPEEIKKYYDEHPALFKERRVYQLQEVGIEAPAEQMAAIGARLKAAKNANEFVEYLKANNVKYVTNQAVRAAEQIPMAALPTVAKLKDGEAMLTPTPTGASVVFLAASRAQPVDEERASKAIATYLLNERKRKLITDDVKALRGSAKIEYAGKYAASAPVAETFRAPTPAEVAASAAAALDNKSINEGLGLKSSAGAAAASAVQAADAAVRPASGVDAATITKGLGLK